MEAKELQEARTNPDFLKFLLEKEELANETRSIKELYEVLDVMLVLDLDENKINTIFDTILQVAFEKVEEALANKKPLDLASDDLYIARAIYEYAIENWSSQNPDGAKGIFYILISILEDKHQNNSLMVHIISTHNQESLESFYNKVVPNEANQDIYGYFITNYNFDIDEYIKENINIINDINTQIQSMMG